MTKVLTLGSLNMDMVMTTKQMPTVGETILGETIDYFLGGKGANQAVAASRIGVPTKLIGKIGMDTFGEKIKQHLGNETIDLAGVICDDTVFTGVASIFKLPQDNAIVVLPGANSLLTAQELSAKDFQEGVLLTQLEIPIETVLQGLQLAKKNQMQTILNPAPYHRSVPTLLPWVDIITPNETEFADMVGKKIQTASELETEMLNWVREHQTQLIVTRGAEGVSYVEKHQLITVRAPKATVVDTTGAGDTFNGVLAAKLAQGMAFTEAVEWATTGASLAVEKLGAQTGMPSDTQIREKMKEK
uniref:ribokinase n=1 Tax=Candidatus Enterococcus willemsii TaxID=1857215 RepID=UPI00403F8ED1